MSTTRAIVRKQYSDATAHTEKHPTLRDAQYALQCLMLQYGMSIFDPTAMLRHDLPLDLCPSRCANRISLENKKDVEVRQ